MREKKFYLLHFDRQNKKKILATIEHWKMLNSLFKKKTILILAQPSKIKQKGKKKLHIAREGKVSLSKDIP